MSPSDAAAVSSLSCALATQPLEGVEVLSRFQPARMADDVITVSADLRGSDH